MDKLRGKWPDNVIKQQENWIGKSEGTIVKFKYRDIFLEVFTTRVDTIYGVSFISIAPEHPILNEILKYSKNKTEIENYIKSALNKSEIERKTQKNKTGIFTYEYAIHPLTNEEIPIFVADYVLYDYGTGIVMGVPAHDQRDYEFAKIFNLEIKPVIKPTNGQLEDIIKEKAFEEYGILINSYEFNNLDSRTAIIEITKRLEDLKLGKKAINYRLRDWLISRQRYWGCPIPIVYCDNCGIVEIPENELPVLLPEKLEVWKPIGGYSPLENDINFVWTNCPKCKGKAKRETDTMDTFVDSSWYFLRFIDPHNNNEIINKRLEREFMPVDLYIGGVEHATKHLIYARFIYKVLYDEGIVNYDEPFENLFTQGLVLKKFYWDPINYKTVDEEFVIEKNGKFYHKETGIELEEKIEMMSKSKGNVVDPWYIIGKYGVEATRWYFFTINQPWDPKLFSEKDIAEILRKFILTFWNCYLFFETYGKKKEAASPRSKNILDKWIVSRLESLIEEVTENFENYDITRAGRLIEKFVIEDLSLWYIRRSRKRFQKPKNEKELKEASQTLKFVLLNLSKILAPFLPFLAEFVYQRVQNLNFKFSNSVHLENWPKVNKKLIDKKLERKMEKVREIVSQVLAERQKAKIKVRQPLKELQITNYWLKKEPELIELIKEEVNVKNISFGKGFKLDTKITPELKEEGIIREIIRHIQEMRKEASLKPKDKILVGYLGGKYISEILEKNKESILEEARVLDLKKKEGKFDLEKEVKVENEKIILAIKKVSGKSSTTKRNKT